jgi:hypothetical protein
MSRITAHKRTPIIAGDTFNRLTFLQEAERRNNTRYGLFQCSCGEKAELQLRNVMIGKQKSCGCLLDELRAKKECRVCKDAKEESDFYNDASTGKKRAICKRCFLDKKKARSIQVVDWGLIASPLNFSLSKLHQ